MARRKGKSQRTRTRTITKFKTRFRNVKGRARSFRSKHSGKVDHAILITAGAGAGALTTTVLQILRGNGIAIPAWADYLASGVTGFLTGRHISKNNMKALESAMSAVGTSYVENRVVSGQPILNLNLGSGSGSIGGNVY